MERTNVSLKWLEAFQAVGRFGSVREGAAQLGVSESTVSHHIACLEDGLGVTLFEHGRRPMRLTRRGEALLARIDDALAALRKGLHGVSSEDPKAFMRLVRIAAIEDFDVDVSPVLIAHLANLLPACDFAHLSRPSHQVFELLRSEQVDIGIAASTEFDTSGLIEAPVLRDPFIVVTPAATDAAAAEVVAGTTGLPFLRYSREQLMGRRIDLHLRRLGLFLPAGLESESTHTILSLVAAGRGWTITTALGIARARRLLPRLRPLPFPDKAFSRTISLFRRDTLPDPVYASVEQTLRRTTETGILAPLTAQAPWLADQFRCLPFAGDGSSAPESLSRGSETRS